MKRQEWLQPLEEVLPDFPKATASRWTPPYIAVSARTAFVVISTCVTGARYWVFPAAIIGVREHLQSSFLFPLELFTNFPTGWRLKTPHCLRLWLSRCTLFLWRR